MRVAASLPPAGRSRWRLPASALACAVALCALPGVVGAQGGVASAPASVAMTAHMPPSLAVTGAAVTDVELAGEHVVAHVAVGVRANTPHRVVVSLGSVAGAEILDPTGNWVPLHPGAPVDAARSTTATDATHLLRCRVPRAAASAATVASGCGLVYELRPTLRDAS